MSYGVKLEVFFKNCVRVVFCFVSGEQAVEVKQLVCEDVKSQR